MVEAEIIGLTQTQGITWGDDGKTKPRLRERKYGLLRDYQAVSRESKKEKKWTMKKTVTTRDKRVYTAYFGLK